MKETTRAEHLEWCKGRAFTFIDTGDLQQAFTSMVSDLNKHPETQGHAGAELGMMHLMAGLLGTPEAMRTFIKGFN